MTGEEIARELCDTFTAHDQYGVHYEYLYAAMHDQAAYNRVAIHFIGVVHPSLMDIECFCHILDLQCDTQ